LADRQLEELSAEEARARSRGRSSSPRTWPAASKGDGAIRAALELARAFPALGSAQGSAAVLGLSERALRTLLPTLPHVRANVRS